MSAALLDTLNQYLREERNRQQARRDGYQCALYETRNVLLIAALGVVTEWRNQLARDGDRVRSATHLKFAAQLQGLNRAFEELSTIEPRITTRLDIERLQKAALQRSEFECHSKSMCARTGSSCEFTRRYPDIDEAEFEAGYRYTRESLNERLFSARCRMAIVLDSEETVIREKQAIREIAIAASRAVRDNWGDRGRGPERLDHPDFDRGSRRAIMDWSHKHNRRLTQVIQVLNEFTDRKPIRISGSGADLSWSPPGDGAIQ